MSCYASCAFDCAYKDLARNIFQDLNNSGIKTFFSGDIPDNRRREISSELIAAREQATVFIPIISEASEQHKECQGELGMAFEWGKTIIPIKVQPGVFPVTPFLTGIRISDMSSPDEYEAKLLEIIQTIQPLIPGKKDRTTGSAAGDQDI